MAISLDEILDLGARYHHLVGVEKGDAAAQAAFFIHPDPIIYVEHASDLTLQANYESHQGMTDEQFFHLEPWNVIQFCAEPERARAVGGVLWQGQPTDDRAAWPHQGGRGRGLDRRARTEWRREVRGCTSTRTINFFQIPHRSPLPDQHHP